MILIPSHPHVLTEPPIPIPTLSPSPHRILTAWRTLGIAVLSVSPSLERHPFGLSRRARKSQPPLVRCWVGHPPCCTTTA
jgi:hypothetical protein